VAFTVRAVNAAGVVSGAGGDTVGVTTGGSEAVVASGLPAASASGSVTEAIGVYATSGAEPRASSDAMMSMTESEPDSVSGAEGYGGETHVPALTPARMEAGAEPLTVQSPADVVPLRDSLNVTIARVDRLGVAEAMVGAIPSAAVTVEAATALPAASASVGPRAVQTI